MTNETEYLLLNRIETTIEVAYANGQLPKYLDASRCTKTLEDWDAVVFPMLDGDDDEQIASELGYELYAVRDIRRAIRRYL